MQLQRLAPLVRQTMFKSYSVLLIPSSLVLMVTRLAEEPLEKP
jgi:hypothetical protein